MELQKLQELREFFETNKTFVCSHCRQQKSDSKRNWKTDKDAHISVGYKKSIIRSEVIKNVKLYRFPLLNSGPKNPAFNL